MREITDDNELRTIIYNILKSVTDFCEQNHLKYYLTFGTLLGAVRHNGFIPWDDDVDIMMPRDDYEHFLRLYKSTQYKVVDLDNDIEYFYPYAKVYDISTKVDEQLSIKTNIGVYIDVFPLDNAPNGRFAKLKQYYLFFLQKVMKHKFAPINRPRSSWKKVFLPFTKMLVKIVSIKKLGNKINGISKRFNAHNTNYVGIFTWGYYNKLYPVEYLEPFVRIKFQEASFRCPKNFDGVLRKLYGDYMQLPPENQRVCKHGFRAYINENAKENK